MANITGSGSGPSEEAFDLFNRLCSTASEAAKEQTDRGKPVKVLDVFRHALTSMDCDRQELLTLWVTLESALLATRQAAGPRG